MKRGYPRPEDTRTSYGDYKKPKGWHRHRTPPFFNEKQEEEVREMYSNGMTMTAIAKHWKCSIPTVSKAIQRG